MPATTFHYNLRENHKIMSKASSFLRTKDVWLTHLFSIFLPLIRHFNVLERVSPTMIKAIRYGMVGLGCSLLDLTLFTTIVYFDYFPVLGVNVFTYLTGTGFSFLINSHTTFCKTDKIVLRSFLFFLAALIGLSVSSVLLYIGQATGINIVIMKVITLGAVFVIQFSLNNFITFR